MNASGPVIATAGLASLTAVALLPGLALMTVSGFVIGIGIGVYNVHLVAWAMDSVAPANIAVLQLAALLMFRFVRITRGKPALAGERRDVSPGSS
jgi:hypothetical protein